MKYTVLIGKPLRESLGIGAFFSRKTSFSLFFLLISFLKAGFDNSSIYLAFKKLALIKTAAGNGVSKMNTVNCMKIIAAKRRRRNYTTPKDRRFQRF